MGAGADSHWRRGARRLLPALVAYALVEAVAVVVFRWRWGPAITAIRRFNKGVLNPLMLTVAGSSWWYAAALEHVGRRSGRTYVTPVVAVRAGERFLVPLPYGSDVDWCRNVIAAGSCVLVDHGTRYELDDPRVVPAAEVAADIPARRRRLLGLFGVDAYLTSRVDGSAPSFAASGRG